MQEDTLQCSNECDSACQACILTYETQHHLDQLNRHSVLQLISRDFLNAFELPAELRVFGPNSRLELEPLTLAVDREWQRWKFDQVRVYLGGEATAWDPLQWRFLESLRRFCQREMEITLILKDSVMKKLEQSQRDELYVIGSELKAKLQVVGLSKKPMESNELVSVIEVGNAKESIQWIASDCSALTPDDSWGSGNAGATYVRSPRLKKSLDQIDGATEIHADELRSAPLPGIAQLEVKNELTGPTCDFGKRAWEMICKLVPELEASLQSDKQLKLLTYTDRYLRSPLSILLLEQLIGALEKHTGGLSSESQVRIMTAGLGKSHHNAPRSWSHDWQDRQDMKWTPSVGPPDGRFKL